ncbi:hypothetical protein HPC49_18215 [Pyxidicoccus fallax]|uniref:Uncharacterized protein n=1 Tax=Pyxidicoccus fallax TaxID=394095 RepID=A0A848LKD2_9BACT|nr:hypothetical protein [Pyxidicoccus fallax]NMO18227.1 hypothetical protein [Pyxidicoccus fallax]NPC80147.1 hypothetical protein [Pyxidicoccus fallax]
MEPRVIPVGGTLPPRTHAVLRLPRWKALRKRLQWLPEDRYLREQVIASTVSMVGVTVALFLAPGVNGLLAGWAASAGLGGRRSLGPAVVASVFASLGLWLILGPGGMPILGLYPGVDTGEAVLLSVAGLLTGTALRGLLAWAWAFRPWKTRGRGTC